MRIKRVIFFALVGLIGVEAIALTARARALRRFAPIPNGTALSRGCRTGGPAGINVTNPAWVSVSPADNPTVMEGTVLGAKATFEDFPTNHESHDWNWFVKPAPGYQDMLTDAPHMTDGQATMECEWETRHLPDEFLPAAGDTVWMIGRHIFDCGHPPYRTEIHPPQGMALTRLDPHLFAGDSAPSMTNKTRMVFHAQGGYFYNPIGGRDYTFTIPLPPRPSLSAELRTEIVSVTGGVRPVLTPEPFANRVRVTFPLTGHRDSPSGRWNLYANSLGSRPTAPQPHFGAVVASGWRETTLTRSYRTLRVTVDNVRINDDQDPVGEGEFFFWVRVNGTWTKVMNNRGVDSGSTVPIGRSFLVTIPDTGAIDVETTGWESDGIDDHFGFRSPGSIPNVASLDQNDTIGTLLRSHGSSAGFGVGSHDVRSSTGDFNLRYRIEEVRRFPAGTAVTGGATTTGRKRVTVTFDRVRVIDDTDPFGSGEIWFDFDVNGQRARVPASGTRDISSGSTVNLGNSLSVDVDSSDTLRVFMKGTDDDSPDADDSLGEMIRNFDATNNFGAGTHTVLSTKPDGQFEVTFRISVANL